MAGETLKSGDLSQTPKVNKKNSFFFPASLFSWQSHDFWAPDSWSLNAARRCFYLSLYTTALKHVVLRVWGWFLFLLTSHHPLLCFHLQHQAFRSFLWLEAPSQASRIQAASQAPALSAGGSAAQHPAPGDAGGDQAPPHPLPQPGDHSATFSLERSITWQDT